MNTPRSVRDIMVRVVLALIPGLLFTIICFGPALLLQIIVALTTAWLAEWIGLRARGIQQTALSDVSPPVTALLIVAALPPTVPVQVTITACTFAILLGKHAFGGLGQNPFNPAMVGYAVAFVTFPAEVARWPVPEFVWSLPSLQPPIDGLTAATALDAFKNRESLTLAELRFHHAAFGSWGGAGFEWIAFAWFAGGVWLFWQGVITWHAPVGMLATLTFCSLLGYQGESSTSAAPPTLQLLSGGTLMAAFFVVTDPASGATSRRGQLVFGTLVGLLTFVIRQFGAHPDGLAFAVLLANAAVPLIDRWTLRMSRQ